MSQNHIHLSRVRKTRVLQIIAALIIVLAVPLTLSLLQSPQKFQQNAAGNSCNNTGVTKNPDGTYSFAWLHVASNGDVVDPNGCLIHLLGINQGGLFLGNASGTTDLTKEQQTMDFFHSQLPSNVVRVNYNSYWWDSDVYVPDAQMHFKQWLQTYVSMQEKAGNYVILDTGPQFHNPPCGNDPTSNPPVHITQCPSQNQAQKNIPPDPTEQITYQPPALQGLTDLATLYKNDPAVIFDVWNEPTTKSIDETTYVNDMKQRIQTVRTIAAKSLIMVWIRDQQTANYTDTNMMWSIHNYDPHFVMGNILPAIQYARSHAQASIVSEYGGAVDSASAQVEFTKLAIGYNVNLAYFQAGNLGNQTNKTPPTQLTANGQLVQQSYTSIFGSQTTGIPTSTMTPSINPSQTPSPIPGASLQMTLFLHDIGLGGDNVTPNATGNNSPIHPTRTAVVTLLSQNNQVIASVSGNVTFNATTGNFGGTISLGNTQSGNYLLLVHTDGFLTQMAQGIIQVQSNQVSQVNSIYLVTGDINNDNQIDILDYNILIGCFGSKMSTSSCTAPPTTTSAGADINDDGVVDGVDYNEFLRELSVQKGS